MRDFGALSPPSHHTISACAMKSRAWRRNSSGLGGVPGWCLAVPWAAEVIRVMRFRPAGKLREGHA